VALKSEYGGGGRLDTNRQRAERDDWVGSRLDGEHAAGGIRNRLIYNCDRKLVDELHIGDARDRAWKSGDKPVRQCRSTKATGSNGISFTAAGGRAAAVHDETEAAAWTDSITGGPVTTTTSGGSGGGQTIASGVIY